MRRVRSLLFVLVAAALGAVLGRIALEARQKMDAGESPTSVDLRHVTLRVQDIVPGLVAAFRVKDAPWSWFHIPSWLAAFGVNFGLTAVGGDITRLREQVERMAFEVAGLDARDFGLGGDYEEGAFDSDVSASDSTAAPAPEPPPAPSFGAP
jgi:hypothetical protein